MTRSRASRSRRSPHRAPGALGSRLLRGLLGAFGGTLLAFHALALWHRIEEASLLRTDVGLRWLASALLLVLLWRVRGQLRSRRRLLALGTLVLLLHLGVGGPIELGGRAELARPLLVVLPIGLALGGITLLGAGLGLHGSGAPAPRLLLSGSIASQRVDPFRRALLRPLAPRGPPVVLSFPGR